MGPERFAGRVAIVTGGAQGLGVLWRVVWQRKEPAEAANRFLPICERSVLDIVLVVDVQNEDCGRRLVRKRWPSEVELLWLCCAPASLGLGLDPNDGRRLESDARDRPVGKLSYACKRSWPK